MQRGDYMRPLMNRILNTHTEYIDPSFTMPSLRWIPWYRAAGFVGKNSENNCKCDLKCDCFAKN